MFCGLGSIVHHTSLEGHSNSHVLMQRLFFSRCEECPKAFPVFQDKSFLQQGESQGHYLLPTPGSQQQSVWLLGRPCVNTVKVQCLSLLAVIWEDKGSLTLCLLLSLAWKNSFLVNKSLCFFLLRYFPIVCNLISCKWPSTAVGTFK